MGRPGEGLPRWVEAPLALAGLVFASPVLVLVGMLVRLSSPGPVIFRQQRVGRAGRPFTLFKFRTMAVAGEGPSVTASGDPRITPVGRFLRRTKLDELPELWNVLRGEMSFVGPRPEVPELVDLSNPLWREVLEVRPGITDPMTLSLRNEEELLQESDMPPEVFYREVLQPRKLRGYVEYLRRRSAWADIGVILSTVITVFMGLSLANREQNRLGEE